MGCLPTKKASHSLPMVEENVKQYSWSNRDRSEASRFVITNVSNTSQCRLPGEINGEQFSIENCTGSSICLLDLCNTVTIDDCRDCTIFIGAVIGSVAIRDCHDCRIMCASQQLRARDCKRLDLYLCCATQPAIESCHNLQFGCFSANYSHLQEQFRKANLNIFNNNWFFVYDFTMDQVEKHWSIISNTTGPNEHFAFVQRYYQEITFQAEDSFVPQTKGVASLDFTKQREFGTANIEHDHLNNQFGLILIYGHNKVNNSFSIELEILKFIRKINKQIKNASLMLSKSICGEKARSIESRLDAKGQECISTSQLDHPHCFFTLLYQVSGEMNALKNLCAHHDEAFKQDSVETSAIKLKLITNSDNEECDFQYYLTIVFDHLVSC